MPRRRHPHADEHRPVSAEEQMAGTIFAYPAGSQPRNASEAAADRVVASGRAPSLRLMALQRIARSPVSADHLRGEFEDALGHEVAANSIAPRLTELVNDGYAEYQEAVVKTRYGATAEVYRITTTGLQLLREIEAKRRTAGGSFEHPKGIRP